MRGFKFFHWLGAATAAQAVVAAAAMGLVSHSPQEPRVLGVTEKSAGGNGKDKGTGNDKQVVLASGTVEGLFPGAVKDLPVLLENRNNFDVVVTELAAGIAHAAPGCTAGNIDVDDFTGRRLVPGNGTATQMLVIRMGNDAPDSCKSVTWQLTYSGRAQKDKL